MAANPDVQLREAARDIRLNRVRELLASGVDPNTPDQWGVTALHNAVRYAYENEADARLLVEALVASGAVVNPADDEGTTPLMLAATYDYPELVSYLLANRADVNQRNSDGLTAISLIESAPSLARKHKRVLALLDKAGGQR